jgi:hypothetical protein
VELEASERFYSGALERIRRFMLALAFALTLACWLRFGWRLALGFAAGCAIAYLNFYWLKRVVSALADKVTNTGERQSGQGAFLRFLLRYFLIALGAYLIFKISPGSLYGLLAGIFLPVAGIICEGAYEMYVALRRGA